MPEVEARYVRNGKLEISQYLLDSNKTGNFNPWRTLSVLFFIIPVHLASICAVVLAGLVVLAIQ